MKAFRLIDVEGKGRISLRNLTVLARELGESLSEEELALMIDEFDEDGDGESKCGVTQFLRTSSWLS